MRSLKERWQDIALKNMNGALEISIASKALEAKKTELSEGRRQEQDLYRRLVAEIGA